MSAGESPPTTAVYARISEVDDTDEPTRGRSDGVDRQVADGMALCRKNRWAHLDPFVDNDYSASDYATKVRPAYQAMMRLVRAGGVTRIVCWDVDRLYRRMKELEELIELANAGRLSIVSMHGDLDLSTGEGRFLARSLVNMAQKSSDDTSRRIRRQRQAWRDKGIAKGGRTAFGWKDAMTPDPKQVKLINNAMKAVLAGESLTAIARDWNERGVPTQGGGKHWTHDVVRQVLINPRHIGKMTHGREILGDGRATHKRQIVGDAQWPSIVDRETFERVSAIVDSRAAHLVGKAHPRLPYSGVLVCGRCGANLTGHKNNGKRAWRCMRLEGSSASGCNGITILAEPLEAHICEVLFRYVDNVTLAQLLDADSDDQRANVIAKLTDLERRADEYLDMLGSGELDRAGYAKLRQRLLAEQAALTNRLAQTERHSVLAPYVGRPGRLQKEWANLSIDRKRAILSAALAPIRILPGGRGRRFNDGRVCFGERAESMAELLSAS
jgi:DNA invertase Pin-like site-specific DNA recombinase